MIHATSIGKNQGESNDISEALHFGPWSTHSE